MISLKAFFLCLLVSKICCVTVNFKFTFNEVTYYGHADSGAVSHGRQWLTLTSVNMLNPRGSMTTKDLVGVYTSFKPAKNLRDTAISATPVLNSDFTVDDVKWQAIYIILVEPNGESLQINYVLHQTFLCSFMLGNYRYSVVTAESIVGSTKEPWLKICKIETVDDQSPNKGLDHQEMDNKTSTLATRIGKDKFEDFKLSVDGTNETIFITVVSAEVLQAGRTSTAALAYKILSFWNFTFLLGGKTYYGVAEEVSSAPQTLQIRDVYTEVNKKTSIGTITLFNCYQLYKNFTNAKIEKIATPYYECFDENKTSLSSVSVVSFTLTGETLQFSYM